MALKRYHWPSSIKEAVSLLDREKNARPICGGTEINLKYKEVETLVDLRNLGLNYIKDANFVRIGAATTIGEIESSPLIKKQYEILNRAARSFTQSVKNLATIGGSIAEGVPSSDIAPVLIALNAKVVLVSPKGERTVAVHDLFAGLRKTKIGKNEIIREFILPKYGKNTKFSFQRIGRTEHDLAMTNLAVRLTMDGKKVKDVGIGVGLAAPHPLKATGTEKFLKENGLKIEEACEKLLEETYPRSSIRASKEYRVRLEKVLLKRALLECSGGNL